MKQSNPFPGLFVPREVLLNVNLSSTDKLIYAIIQGLDNANGCYASNAYIGSVVGVGAESVRQSICKLEENKLIVRSHIAGSPDRTIKTIGTVSLEQVPNNSCPPPQENLDNPPKVFAPNNTSNNTRDNKQVLLPHGSAFKEIWERWLAYRKEKKKPLTPTTIKMQLETCAAHTEQACIDSINKSMTCGWMGLFFTNQSQFNRVQPKPLTSKDHEQF